MMYVLIISISLIIAKKFLEIYAVQIETTDKQMIVMCV